MVAEVSPFARAGAFAATELVLDIFYSVTKFTQLDIEATWILAVIGHETMRPWILDPDLAAKHIADVRVPDQVRGSISRMMVADRTGLPRETVRRRIAELTEKGLITLDERGFVRLSGQRAATPEYRQTAADIYGAVERYRKRIADLGIEAPE